MDHNFLNGPVRALDEKGRCGIGNDRQDPVRLRFNLYQGPNSPVLSGASYRGHAKPHCAYRQTSCQSQEPHCPDFRSYQDASSFLKIEFREKLLLCAVMYRRV
jgi:hypothetical protein